MAVTCDQKRFTISEVAADWHEELTMLQRTMQPSIAHTIETGPAVLPADIPSP